jgi:hypothetical protein
MINTSDNKKLNVNPGTVLSKVFITISMIIIIVISPVFAAHPFIDMTYTEQVHAKQQEQKSEKHNDNTNKE